MRTISIHSRAHAMPSAQAGRTAEWTAPPWIGQAAWFIGGAALAFLIPNIGTSLFSLGLDWYYLLYFALISTFLWLYVTRTGVDLGEVFRRNWRLSLILGLAAAAFLVVTVLQREPATPRPEGFYFAFETVWRGAVYGAVDALLLAGFPCLVAFAVLEGRVSGLKRRLGFVLLALVLCMGITATYHLGYQQFRDQGIASPEVGAVVTSLPMLATINPVGSMVAHAAMHVTANVHSYETNVFLPPQVGVR